MSEQLQDLIEKIKKEGVQKADELGRSIEAQARQKADEIIRQANVSAGQIIGQAQAERQKMMDSARIALKQASRDVLLNLRKEIDATLRKIIARDVGRALTPDNLAGIIHEAIAGYFKHQPSGHSEVAIVLSAHDLKNLKDGFVAELKEKLKHPVTLKSASHISAGFTISFDGGKSFFDFTDESLAEYLSVYLNAEVAKILKESLKS